MLRKRRRVNVPHRSRRARLTLLLAIAIVALALPASAYAWEQYYVSATYFNPDGIGLSEFNGNLNYNEISWSDFGGSDYMQLTLCNAAYQCYDYKPDSSGFGQDYRTIDYGRAKCHSFSGNNGYDYIESCYTNNFV